DGKLQASGTGSIHAPVLTSLSASLSALSGGLLDLHSVTSYAGGVNIKRTIQTSGSGSRIDLSGIQTFDGSQGNDVTTITVNAGGTFNLGTAAVNVSQRLTLNVAGGTVTTGTLSLVAPVLVSGFGTINGNVT